MFVSGSTPSIGVHNIGGRKEDRKDPRIERIRGYSTKKCYKEGARRNPNLNHFLDKIFFMLPPEERAMHARAT